MPDIKVKIKGDIFEGLALKTATDISLELRSHSSNLENYIKKKMHSWSGNFSLSIETPTTLLCVTDKIRSFPILINTNLGKICVFEYKKTLNKEMTLDKDAALSFYYSGYTLSDSTLLNGVLSVPAGHYYICDKTTKKKKKMQYFSFKNKNFDKYEQNETNSIEKLHSIYTNIFKKVIDKCDGRKIVIPLSGGYDSRIVLSYLKYLKYPDILTFSYGNKGFWELDFAKKIAEKAGVPWLVYNLTSEDRDSFFSVSTQKFYWQATNYEQVPQMNDFYAIRSLIDSLNIPRDAIVINGQSGDFTDGGHIPSELVGLTETNDALGKIKDKHFGLWMNKSRDADLQHILNKNEYILENFGFNNNSTENWRAFEEFEYLHRQSKSVVNGQRVYDHFGLDWHLPLWDTELLNFWMTEPLEFRFNRSLTKNYAKKVNLLGLFDFPTSPQRVWDHMPFWVRFISFTFSKSNNVKFSNEILGNYYGTYGNYYPIKGYKQYLKKTRGHRNAFSFHSSYILEKLNENKN